MKHSEIPTPETDAFEINSPETRANAIMALNTVVALARDLERRLTVARHALERLDNDLMRDAQRKLIIRVALTETAPKP